MTYFSEIKKLIDIFFNLLHCCEKFLNNIEFSHGNSEPPCDS